MGENKVSTFFDFITRIVTEDNAMKAFEKAKAWFLALKMVYDIGMEAFQHGGVIVDELGEAMSTAQVVDKIAETDDTLAEAARSIFAAVQSEDGSGRSIPTQADAFLVIISPMMDNPFGEVSE